MAEDGPLLEVEGLVTEYRESSGLLGRRTEAVRAVDGVSFELRRGEVLGLVGESGCGKSTLAASILRLQEPTAGTVRFDGDDVLAFDADRLKRFRREAQLLLQDPGSSFDPRMRVGASVTEPLAIHGMDDRRRRRAIGEDLLRRVGLDAPDYDRYPHEFSGGQLQRLALARALVVNPRLLVADEPVSALDVSVQRQVLSLLADLQAELDLAVLLVSHDLAVVREVADRVAVMYLGELVEVGPTASVFADPHHPYTEALVSAIPEPDPGGGDDVVRLTGEVPDAADPPPGCRFHTRCPAVIQPPDVDLDQAVWRRLVDASERIADGAVDVETIAAVRTRDRDGERGDSDRDAVGAVIREEFGLGEPLTDESAEAALDDAVSALAGGDRERAASRLADVVRTPCSTREPRLRPIGDGRTVACHLHHPPAEDDGVDGPREHGPAGFEWFGDSNDVGE